MIEIMNFVIEHWPLVLALLVLVVLYFYLERMKGGGHVSPQQLTDKVNHGDAVVLDIRAATDYKKGHITGSINIPSDQLESKVSSLEKYKTGEVILVCALGQVSSASGQLLQKHGIKNTFKLTGGINAWTMEQLPLVK